MLLQLVYTVISSINYQIFTLNCQKPPNNTPSGANNTDRKSVTGHASLLYMNNLLGEHAHKFSESNNK